MSVTPILLALLAQAPANTQVQVDVGRAGWASLQRLDTRVTLPTVALIERVERILASGACSLPRQRPQRFDFTVNYAVRFDAAAQAERVLVEDMGCEPLELLVGNVVSGMLRTNSFELPEGRAQRWFANSINFNLGA